MPNNVKLDEVELKEETKYVGSNIPLELYWKFKQAAAARGESNGEAVLNAVRLYVDIVSHPELR